MPRKEWIPKPTPLKREKKQFRKQVKGKTLTPIEVDRLREFITNTFTEDIWDKLGYSPTDWGIREIFDHYCSDVEKLSDCYEILKQRFYMYIKPELKEKLMIEKYEAMERERRVAIELERELERLYGTTKLSELYKMDKLKRQEARYEEEAEFIVLNGEIVRYPKGEGRWIIEEIEEEINWNTLLTEQKDHPLAQYIKYKYNCDRLEEIPLTFWEGIGNLILVNNENEIFTQLYWAEKLYQVKPASFLAHRIAPTPLIYFITLKSTYRDDKILACVYEPTVRVYIDGKEYTAYKIFPITHKQKHIIGMIAWIPLTMIREKTLHVWMETTLIKKLGAIGYHDVFY